ncbi:hypothetical protein Tco_0974543 [Tanacetum coccineum]|uniref:Uncharacterized protein n=1 Tax=Tanacetum coccineum TaxID=301880 RepID=A0ABQ5EC26_9ASTR
MEPVVDPVIDDMMELMDNPDEDVDMLMDDDDEDDDNDEGKDDEDGWEVNKEWLMAPVTSPLMPVVPPPSTFEVDGPSTNAPGPPFPVGRPFPEVVSSVAVHHEEISGLSVRIENLEHAHGVLVRKMEDEQAMTKVREVEDRVLEMQDKTLESIVHELRKENQKLKGLLSAKDSDYSMLASYVLGLGERLATMELQLPGLPQGPY